MKTAQNTDNSRAFVRAIFCSLHATKTRRNWIDTIKLDVKDIGMSLEDRAGKS